MKRKASRPDPQRSKAGSPSRRTTTAGQSVGLPRRTPSRGSAAAQAGAAALRQLINTIPDAANTCPLPVGQPAFAQCSRAIANFAATATSAAESSQPLPFPSALLPPPL